MNVLDHIPTSAHLSVAMKDVIKHSVTMQSELDTRSKTAPEDIHKT